MMNALQDPVRRAPSPLIAQARIDTPLGPMTAAATAHGLAGLWFDDQRHHPGPLAAPEDAAHRYIAQVRRELHAYFGSPGRSQAGFTVALDPQGTDFQRSVWQQLLRIARGDTSRYGQLARQLGRPLAARAVGAAVGRNPISIVVPCHRVLGQDGTLTGYAGGLPRKQALLQLEGASWAAPHRQAPPAPVPPAAARPECSRRPMRKGERTRSPAP